MNLKFLETFLWVARLRSFSNAADKLCATQAAVSNRIATLERDLGTRLFERDLRTVTLTAAGQRALPQAEAIVRLAQDLRHSLRDPGSVQGAVVIGAADTIVYAWLPRLIERVKAAYPQVSLDLTVEGSLAIARQVQDGSVDVGLIMGPVIAPHIRNVELCRFECLWIAAARLGLGERPLSLAEIVAFPVFAYSKGSQPHHALLRLIEAHGLEGHGVRIYNSNSLATIVRLIRDGVGIAVLPKVVVREFVESGELQILDVAQRLPALQFHAVYGDDPAQSLPGIIARMAADIAADLD